MSTGKHKLYYSLDKEEKVTSQCRQGSNSYITVSIGKRKLYRSVDREAKVTLQSRYGRESYEDTRRKNVFPNVCIGGKCLGVDQASYVFALRWFRTWPITDCSNFEAS